MNKIEESLHNIFQQYRVVFWYDEEAKMREQYEEVVLEGVEKQEVNNNEFSIKYQILRGNPDKNFLLYLPYGEKPLLKNWLLDLQLSHKEFYTDQESMYLQEMGMDYVFKDFVAEHIEFFRNIERKAKLKQLMSEGDREKDLQLKMMAVVFQTDYLNIETFIQAYALAFIKEDDRIEKELERFNLNKAFWGAIDRKFQYKSVTPSIYDFLIDVFSRNFSLTNKGESIKETHILLSLWKDTLSYQEAFRQVSDTIADNLKISAILEEAELNDLLQDDLFQAIDQKIIHELNNRLVSNEINLENLLSYIKKRENKYWYAHYEDFYVCLEHAGRLQALIEQIKYKKIESVEAAVLEYVAEQHLIDFHYRKFIYHYRKKGQKSLLSSLHDKILKSYTNDWLLPINNHLQDCISSLSHWTHASPKSQFNFFRFHAKKFADKRQRLFVVISDALRYENGWQLYEELQSENRYQAEMDYMITGLPSYTQLGMAALLPHKELTIHPPNCQVKADGISTVGIQGRNKVLQANAGVRAVAVQAEEFMEMNASTVGRAFVKEYDLIYIYHNRIDKTGDDTTSEAKVLKAVEDEIAYLKDLLRKIANVNGNHVFITADHGYIYQHHTLEESEFAVSNVEGEVWSENRRYILGKDLKASNALKHFNGKDVGLAEGMDVLITKGINRLRVKGAGSRYVHGGASLQEIVVPLIKVLKKRSDTNRQVEIDIIKSTDKITTNILAVSFLQQELISDRVLPRQLRMYLRANDGQILSNIFNYTFDAAEGSEREREVKHQFQLSSLASGKYKNQRVHLVLEEPITGTSKWKEYKKYFYTLNISFTNDFDIF